MAVWKLSSARAPVRPRLMILSRRTVSSQSRWSASSGWPQSVTRSLAFSAERGKPSSSILLPGWSFILFFMSVTMMAEETSPPPFMISSTCWPRSVPLATSSRRRSPELRWTTPHSLTRRSHSRPLPDPGPPTTRMILAGRSPRKASLLLRNSAVPMRPSLSESATSNSFLTSSSVGSSPMPRRRSDTSCQSMVRSPSRTLPYCCITSSNASFVEHISVEPDFAP
mmetsp:Transcript_2632/g.6885  ORF Transcript_2632/g.6885 Transcript_2632/m.6885 type:complete len:225 (+) Transcript_2632:316-990(+)